MTNSDNADSNTRSNTNHNHNHNHHHHFIDGIGDGKHHEYDLPNNNEFQQHAFIRKKGIEELKSNIHNSGITRSHKTGTDSHDADTSTGKEQHTAQRLKKEQHLKQQSQLEEENPVAANDKSDSSSSSLHNDNFDQKGPLHQEQPNHHHNQRHHLPNHDHNNPNPSPAVVGSVEYQMQNEHKFFFSSATSGGVTSSSFLIIVFTIIGFLITMNYIFNIFLGKNKSTGNNRLTTHMSKLSTIHYHPKKSSIHNNKNTIAPSSPTTITQSKSSSIINVDSCCIHNSTNNNCIANKAVSSKQSSSLLLHTGTHKQPLSLFSRIKYKLFHPIIDKNGNHHEHVKTTTNKKKTDEWNEDDDDMDIIPNNNNDNDEEDSSSSYNDNNNIIDGYYCYPQQDISNTTRLRKPLDVGLQPSSSSVIQNTSPVGGTCTVENVNEIEYGEYGEFGVGLDGFDTTLQQQHVNVMSESNYSHSRRVMNNNTNRYGGTVGPTGVPIMGSIDYNNRDVCSTSTIDSTSEDDEWDQISTRSSQSHDISLSSSSRMSSHHIPFPNPNNNTTYITTSTTALPPSPMQSPLQTNKRIYVPSPTFDNNSFFDSPTCSINDDDHNNNYKNNNIEIRDHVPMPPEDEEMPTPRIDNYDSSAITRPKRLFTPSTTSYSSYKIPDLPSLGPNLEDDKIIDPTITNENDMTTTTTTTDDPFTTKSPAPRSISVDELKLIRMETGMVERGGLPKWESKVDPQVSKPQLNALVSSPEQCNIIPKNTRSSNNRDIMQSESTIQCDIEHMNINNDEDDVDDEKYFSGETEGANGILHKRKNLTSCSDAASSLTSPIAFTELKMKELIGGGGFGQVWSATWRGTPVAVKVLAVSHKAEHIQKAIIQEFAAEINMVSGMRHPNICLYIGACLEPSNRAIVTGKHDYFFLWSMSII